MVDAMAVTRIPRSRKLRPAAFVAVPMRSKSSSCAPRQVPPDRESVHHVAELFGVLVVETAYLRGMRGCRQEAARPGVIGPGACVALWCACEVAHDIDLGAERQAFANVLLGHLRGPAHELLLADRLDRLECRSRGCERPGVGGRVGKLPSERHDHPLDILEAVAGQQLLARTRATEGHHGRLVLHLGLAGEPEGRQGPGTRGLLDVPPHREAQPAAGYEHPPCLGEGVRRGAPDAAEAGHHVEAAVVPGKRVHVAGSDVGPGSRLTRDRDQAW